ncbi:MAG: hypothetical protein JWO82_2205 [Akkermansiaceae bacterium]|nr:hypothetical protein [Akkermansiaceae bacterium]
MHLPDIGGVLPFRPKSGWIPNMRICRILSLSVVACLLLAEARSEVRHEESNGEFAIKVAESKVSVERKKDHATRTIDGVLWGESVFRKVLPATMLHEEWLLVPLKDYSFRLLDLRALFKAEEQRTGAGDEIILEGGGRKVGLFDRTRAFWSLDRLLEETLVQGNITNDADESWTFFMETLDSEIIVNDEKACGSLVARAVSPDRSYERSFRVICNPARYAELMKKYDAPAKK